MGTHPLPKPFLILAGSSGTGKSRWVRQQAYKYWPQKLENTDPESRPPNYQLIAVRPNWHDSSEVLGYISRLDGLNYVLTDFVKFLVKAWAQWHKELSDENRKKQPTPFFLCLDEMNLAPVEQYFAEYLSVVETRKTANKNIFGDDIPVAGYVVSDPLISAGEFDKLVQAEQESQDKKKLPWTALCQELTLTPDHPVMAMLKEQGLTLPPNLYVVGTVNMDETTHSFSRKVLDRAFVWEMPIGDLARAESLDGGDQLEYKNQSMDLPRYTEGYQVYNDLGGNNEKSMATLLLDFLAEVNAHLTDTPFQISYRVRDELLLLAHGRHVGNEDELWACLDDGLYSKVLPRIEGDEARTRKALLGLLELLVQKSANLPEAWKSLPVELKKGNQNDSALKKAVAGDGFLEKKDPADPFSPVKPWRRSLAKIRGMLLKLEGQFTSFWD